MPVVVLFLIFVALLVIADPVSNTLGITSVLPSELPKAFLRFSPLSLASFSPFSLPWITFTDPFITYRFSN